MRLALFRDVASSSQELQRLVATAVSRLEGTGNPSSASAAEALNPRSNTRSLTVDSVSALSKAWGPPERRSVSGLWELDSSVEDADFEDDPNSWRFRQTGWANNPFEIQPQFGDDTVEIHPDTGHDMCEARPEVDIDIFTIRTNLNRDFVSKPSVPLNEYSFSSAHALRSRLTSHAKSVSCNEGKFSRTSEKDLWRLKGLHKKPNQKTCHACPCLSSASKLGRSRHLGAVYDLTSLQCIAVEVEIVPPPSGPDVAASQSSVRGVPRHANCIYRTRESTAAGSGQPYTTQSNAGVTPSSVQLNSGESSPSKDKGKRPRSSGNDSDDNLKDNGPGLPPKSQSKRPKKKARLICPFIHKDPSMYEASLNWRSCSSPGFETISSLRTHLRDIHGLADCSQECCNLGPDAPKYADTRVAKWRAECLKHCHPSSIRCNHNPFNDGTENPTALISSLPRRRVPQPPTRPVAESSQTSCLSDLSRPEKDETIQALRQRIEALESICGDMQAELQLNRIQIALFRFGQAQPTENYNQALWNSSSALQANALTGNASMELDATHRVVHVSDITAITPLTPRHQLTQFLPPALLHIESSSAGKALTPLTTVDPRQLSRTPPSSVPDLADTTTLSGPSGTRNDQIGYAESPLIPHNTDPNVLLWTHPPCEAEEVVRMLLDTVTVDTESKGAYEDWTTILSDGMDKSNSAEISGDDYGKKTGDAQFSSSLN